MESNIKFIILAIIGTLFGALLALDSPDISFTDGVQTMFMVYILDELIKQNNNE